MPAPRQLTPTLNQVGVWIGALLRQADAIAEREAPCVAAIDTDEGERVSTQGEHLPENGVQHQLSQ
jgi:hypothetical protein